MRLHETKKLLHSKENCHQTEVTVLIGYKQRELPYHAGSGTLGLFEVLL
jgi:hypothetical protein